MSAQGQDLFKNLYRQKLQELAAAARDESNTSFADLRQADFKKPDNISPEKWKRLSGGQRAARYLDSWRKYATGSAGDIGLSEADFLRMTLDSLNISERAANVAISLVNCGLANQSNPTIIQVVKNIQKAVDQNQPIRCTVSQCIAKAPTVRPAKLNYFIGRQTVPQQMPCFTDGLEEKGWQGLERLIKKVDYSVKITMMLGDMDIYTIDGATRWACPASLARLQSELAEVRVRVAESAQRRFGSAVEVRGWSERYSVQDFEVALTRAADYSRWSDRDLFTESEDLYRQYGYRDQEIELNIPSAKMDQFIIDDVVRTAAQYRLEADLIRTDGALQLWAESVPNRIWPIKISNYDGGGTVPALVLV